MMGTGSKTKILLIEDAVPMAKVYVEYLRKEPYEVFHLAKGKEGLDAMLADPPAVVLLDLKLPDMSGMDILKAATEKGLPTAIIIITAHGSVNTAVEAMQAGAADFIVKPFNADRLIYTVRNTLERRELTQIVETYRKEIDKEEFDGFIGSSLEMQGVYRTIESAAKSKATVFITGESGTGKELCAEAVHHQSKRNGGPFIALNCAAIPKDLMESEVFGHVKGAFTGALEPRDGAATLADGGTLFLDEICEMDLALQAKLLRFIQTGTFQKVGSGDTLSVDVRFVCATNKDPWAEVEAGNFREDLYYRLHVIPVELPPLRERGRDVLEIANRFLVDFVVEEEKQFERFADEAVASILNHAWPGNVRELQNVVRNAVVLNDGETIEAAMLDFSGRGGAAPARHKALTSSSLASGGNVVLRPMWEVEMEYIRAALKETDNNVPKAAALLEMSPSTIYRRLRDQGEDI